MTTQLYFVRHGETFLNNFKRMQGWIDSHLTEKGRQQAIATGKALAQTKFTVVASSDLGRARQTKKLIISQLQHQPKATFVLPEFREVNFGSFDGLPRIDAWNTVTENTPYNDQNDIIRHGGLHEVRQLMADADPLHLCEYNPEIIARWKRGVQKLLAESPDQDNMNILVISHGTFIRTISEHYGQYVAGMENVPKNGSVTIFTVDHGQIHLKRYNQLL
ncbi:histidine phosphatase family protein [Limosilactobacillus secaliphilus]|uniref:Alpha-ribazole phosphatase n=1 Tax=Limosilactobacillus secaliphilus TaxID=396268 RepID=A0A0R2I155_9LACO|nr:histidine phosphatase family protein [Limosilactobacillus secaliphilus]KRN58478.1 alpha-ribazole phosphatase [Limosilactobacillus secaliphilus]